MHDYDVRRIHLSDDNSRERSQSLQAVLYVDGHIERTARRNRRGRVVRAVFSAGAVGFAFAIGFFAFRLVRPHAPQPVVANRVTVLDVNKLARNEANGFIPAVPHSQFLPPMPQPAQHAHDILNLPVHHASAAPPKPAAVVKRAPVAKIVAVAAPRATAAPVLATPAPAASAQAPADAAKAQAAAKAHAAAAQAATAKAAATAKMQADHARAEQQRLAAVRQKRLYAAHLARAQANERAAARAKAAALAAAAHPVVVAAAVPVRHRHRHLAIVTTPSIVRFTAEPQTIPAGGGSTICVAAHHASQLSVSLLGEFHPLGLACRRVTPHETTTYTAWAINDRGDTVSDNVTVTVAQ